MKATLRFYNRGVLIKTIRKEPDASGAIKFPPIKADRVTVRWTYQPQEKPMPKKNPPSKYRIVQPPLPEPQIPTEVLATEILAISAAFKKISAGRLKQDALILLIQDAAGGVSNVSRKTIKLVLDSVEQLGAIYTKEASK